MYVHITAYNCRAQSAYSTAQFWQSSHRLSSGKSS